MKIVEVELSDQVAVELEALVKGGWFASESELIRFALLDYLRRSTFTLAEQFQREDIAWALSHKAARK
jgi:Arc/MetJ-type ribon-helix-helix transcriptional regulator